MALPIAASSLFLFVGLTTAASPLYLLSDQFISLINSKQNSWRAGRNFPLHTPVAYLNKLIGLIKKEDLQVLPAKVYDADLIADLPENFDPRTKWTNCPSLNEIRDQGQCGGCWAHGAVEAMTDRVCIYSNGTKNFHFSAQDLLSCSPAGGCNGGSMWFAWKYWRDVGIVSGGSYNSSEGCMPYELPPCEHFIKGKLKTCGDYLPTPRCKKQCVASYSAEYRKDKRRGKNIYTVSGEDNIKAELFTHGPVEAGFIVYEDFFNYKTGVYTHTSGKVKSGHAVKILGWGVEGGKKYWLIANSWNSEWGDNGFVKFLRGENHLGIESRTVAGVPLLHNF